jgi:hypothetical protein
LSGMQVSCSTGPGGTRTTTVTVRKTPSGGSITDTDFTLTLTGTATNASYYSKSVNFAAGDLIHVFVSYTGSGSLNTTHDLAVQLDCF